MEEAAKKDGRSFQTPLEYCENLEKRVFINNWSKGLEGFSLELMTKELGTSKDQVLILCAGVRKELQEMRVSGYWERYVVFGKKPDNFSDAETLIGT
ncbi:hypothetical protein VTN00DRAFT_2741 [Thermoascus crustaceus]|uniref:uncharacterized protein n=1 Tax=Thermoascus crustaceus TaxID=5088 RepID=UPI003743E69A